MNLLIVCHDLWFSCYKTSFKHTWVPKSSFLLTIKNLQNMPVWMEYLSWNGLSYKAQQSCFRGLPRLPGQHFQWDWWLNRVAVDEQISWINLRKTPNRQPETTEGLSCLNALRKCILTLCEVVFECSAPPNFLLYFTDAYWYKYRIAEFAEHYKSFIYFNAKLC